MTTRACTVSTTGNDAVITLAELTSGVYLISDIAVSYSGLPFTAGELTIKIGSTVVFNLDIPSGGILLYGQQMLGTADAIEIKLKGIGGLKGKINVSYSVI